MADNYNRLRDKVVVEQQFMINIFPFMELSSGTKSSCVNQLNVNSAWLIYIARFNQVLPGAGNMFAFIIYITGQICN